MLDIACILTSLDLANAVGALPPYAVRIASAGRRPIACREGVLLPSHQSLQRTFGPLDTLIVSGGTGHHRAAADPVIVGNVRRLARESRRVASVCTGAFVLAAAGLLDGKRATTHWEFAADLSARYPAVSVDPGPIFIRDGDIATAAGVTSAMDLMLAFIQEDHNAELGREVARRLVTYLQRPGNQAQISMFTSAPPAEHGLVREVESHVSTNLAADLTGDALAGLVGVSQRHLTRLFLIELGITPARYVRRARVEAAAQLLATTALPVSCIARRCGFGSTEALRQAFVHRYGATPSQHRATQRPSSRAGGGGR
ncbi:GlxA family transcriptional regulator [Sinomonas mesophila]|uniref:GlxA family transcriptional regulator n=1 Tax=Sinomonas mesophila TaxID=1531955 RepID=UPI001FE65A7A|nr:helix-turn-helix domain-containing protein [Sinomonas mesophila]